MDEKVFDMLTAYIVENQNRFYKLAYSYVKNREDALDAVQSAVCRALEHGKKLRNAEAGKTWFYRILVNECLRLLKERERFPAAEEEKEIPYEEKSFVPSDDLEPFFSFLDQDTRTHGVFDRDLGILIRGVLDLQHLIVQDVFPQRCLLLYLVGAGLCLF